MTTSIGLLNFPRRVEEQANLLIKLRENNYYSELFMIIYPALIKLSILSILYNITVKTIFKPFKLILFVLVLVLYSDGSLLVMVMAKHASADWLMEVPVGFCLLVLSRLIGLLFVGKSRPSITTKHTKRKKKKKIPFFYVY
jgi:hypothetical protein